VPKVDIWESERDGGGNGERGERNRSGSYTNTPFARRIYEEKTAVRVDHRLGENSSKCLHNPLWVFTPPLPPYPYLRLHCKTHRRPRGESQRMTMPLTSAPPVQNVQGIPSTRLSSRTAGGPKGRKFNPCTTLPSLLQCRRSHEQRVEPKSW
jgi:hypothetical protein